MLLEFVPVSQEHFWAVQEWMHFIFPADKKTKQLLVVWIKFKNSGKKQTSQGVEFSADIKTKTPKQRSSHWQLCRQTKELVRAGMHQSVFSFSEVFLDFLLSFSRTGS